MLPQIRYDKAFLSKLKSNYFNAKALYETIMAQLSRQKSEIFIMN